MCLTIWSPGPLNLVELVIQLTPSDGWAKRETMQVGADTELSFFVAQVAYEER